MSAITSIVQTRNVHHATPDKQDAGSWNEPYNITAKTMPHTCSSIQRRRNTDEWLWTMSLSSEKDTGPISSEESARRYSLKKRNQTWTSRKTPINWSYSTNVWRQIYCRVESFVILTVSFVISRQFLTMADGDSWNVEYNKNNEEASSISISN